MIRCDEIIYNAAAAFTWWTYLLFPREISFSLGFGTGNVWLEFNSGLFSSTSPVVSRFFAGMAKELINLRLFFFNVMYGVYSFPVTTEQLLSKLNSTVQLLFLFFMRCL